MERRDMDREQRLAYGKGYNAGVAGRWPEHKPPAPPREHASNVIKAATALRTVVSDFLGAVSTEIEGDEVWESFRSAVRDFDDAMEDITRWLRD